MVHQLQLNMEEEEVEVVALPPSEALPEELPVPRNHQTLQRIVQIAEERKVEEVGEDVVAERQLSLLKAVAPVASPTSPQVLRKILM